MTEFHLLYHISHYTIAYRQFGIALKYAWLYHYTVHVVGSIAICLTVYAHTARHTAIINLCNYALCSYITNM